jgi:hypothetical protein
MTPRRRRHHRPTLSARDVPALAAFARSYLHQDVLVEHADAAEAVRAFCRDASDPERDALAADLARVIGAATGWADPSLAGWFKDTLGAAWSPESFEDLVELGTAAARATRRVK